jgi:predicted ferric reductase
MTRLDREMPGLVSAVLWTLIYLLLVAAPLVLLLIGPMPAGAGFWWDFSMGLGFAGMAMMGVQFALTARFRRAAAPFGIDIIYYFHRLAAIVAFGLLLAHFPRAEGSCRNELRARSVRLAHPARVAIPRAR